MNCPNREVSMVCTLLCTYKEAKVWLHIAHYHCQIDVARLYLAIWQSYSQIHHWWLSDITLLISNGSVWRLRWVLCKFCLFCLVDYYNRYYFKSFSQFAFIFLLKARPSGKLSAFKTAFFFLFTSEIHCSGSCLKKKKKKWADVMTRTQK